jgi:hypothetical protein
MAVVQGRAIRDRISLARARGCPVARPPSLHHGFARRSGTPRSRRIEKSMSARRSSSSFAEARPGRGTYRVGRTAG